MTDPTVFDNLKVVLEGAVYDMDLNGRIQIIERSDIVNLADMSRRYWIAFTQSDTSLIKGGIRLESSFQNVAEEWHLAKRSGCSLAVIFLVQLEQPEPDQCILSLLRNLWGEKPDIKQFISYPFPPDAGEFDLRVELSFKRLITENQINDLPDLTDAVLASLEDIADCLA